MYLLATKFLLVSISLGSHHTLVIKWHCFSYVSKEQSCLYWVHTKKILRTTSLGLASHIVSVLPWKAGHVKWSLHVPSAGQARRVSRMITARGLKPGQKCQTPSLHYFWTDPFLPFGQAGRVWVTGGRVQVQYISPCLGQHQWRWRLKENYGRWTWSRLGNYEIKRFCELSRDVK